MDYELEQNILVCYETVGQATVCQEETQEAIVPDACPDILRIADVCAQAFPARWEAKDGQATVIGVIQATVLYIPDSGQQLQKMELRLPFTATAELPEAGSDVTLEVHARLRHADARILNPRKVLLRCDLLAEITAQRKKEFPFSCGVHNADAEHICQKRHEVAHERLTSVPQRIFPLSEEIRLTGTQAQTLLASRAAATCTECRIIGSKIIFKGKLDAELLLQSADGNVERRTESFPFSQILEAKGAGESGTCLVFLEVSEFSCVQPLDDPFHLMVEAEVLAMGQVREQETIFVLSDLYSTTHHTRLDLQSLKLSLPHEMLVIPQTLRDLLETDDVVRSICDSRFSLGQILCVQDGDAAHTLTAQGQICVLYLDEERQLRCMKKEAEIPVHISTTQETQLRYHCISSGELFAAPCAGGIEVRLGIEFHVLSYAAHMVSMVSHAEQEEPRNTESQRPSIVLRLPEAGETLWDIAKACGTTSERIMQANEMSGDALPQKMLLIPSAR